MGDYGYLFAENLLICLSLIGLVYLTLLHSERLKLCAVLAFLSAVGLICFFMLIFVSVPFWLL